MTSRWQLVWSGLRHYWRWNLWLVVGGGDRGGDFGWFADGG